MMYSFPDVRFRTDYEADRQKLDRNLTEKKSKARAEHRIVAILLFF